MRVNWNKAPVWAKWAAQDRSGQWRWYSRCPRANRQEGRWQTTEQSMPAEPEGVSYWKYWVSSLESRP